MDGRINLRNADFIAKFFNRFGGKAAAAQTADGRHPRIIPAADKTFSHQLQQPALTHHRAVDIQPRKLDLLRMVDARQLIDEPVVKRSVILEFQRTDRMSDSLYCVFQSVSPIIHRINAPFTSRFRMFGMKNAVHDRIAHIEIRRRHVDFGAQHLRPVGELTVFHAAEKIEILFNRTVAERALRSRFCQRSAGGADLLHRRVVNVGFSRADQINRPLIKLIEIRRGKVKVFSPIESEPPDIFHDGVDVLHVFLDGIGIVETEVAAAAVLPRQPEIQINGFGVSDVEVAVRFGRKARYDAAVVFPRFNVAVNNAFDKVAGNGFSHKIPPKTVMKYIITKSGKGKGADLPAEPGKSVFCGRNSGKTVTEPRNLCIINALGEVTGGGADQRGHGLRMYGGAGRFE